jgi:hypothetical protein
MVAPLRQRRVCALTVAVGVAFCLASGRAPATGPESAGTAAEATKAVAPAVTMTAGAGLGKRLKMEKWGPVRCVLSNDSGRDVHGVVTVEVPGTDSGTQRYTAPVALPFPSKRAVWLYIRPLGYLDDVRVTFRPSEGGPALEERPSVVTQVDTAPTALLVTKRDVGFRRALGGGQMGYIDAADATLEELPDRAIGYEPVNMLLTDGVSFRSMTPQQEQALRHWILDGGRLVVATGRHADLIPGTLVEDLLPVTLGRQTTRTIAAERVAERQRGFGRVKMNVPRLAEPVVMARCEPRPGADVLVQDADGFPLVVTQELGKGGVMFLAFDLSSAPLLTSDRLPALYRGVLQWAGLVPPDMDRSYPSWMTRLPQQREALDAGIQAAVYQTAATTVPPLSSLAIFLGAYVLIVGPVDYFLLKKLRRRHWTMLTFPLIVAGFTYGAYYSASKFKGRQVFVNEINIIHQRGDSARADSYFGVYSPKTASYDLRLRDASAALYPLAPLGGEEPSAGYSRTRPAVRSGRVIRRGGGTMGYSYPQPGPMMGFQTSYPGVGWYPGGGYVVPAEPYRQPYVTEFGPESAGLPGTPINMWAMRTFFAQWWLDGGGVTATLAFKNDRVTGTLTNGSRFDLAGCMLVFQGVPMPAGDLPAGVTKRVDVDVSPRAQRERWGSGDILKGADKEETAARRAALATMGIMVPVAAGEEVGPSEVQGMQTMITRGGYGYVNPYMDYGPGSPAGQQPKLIGWTREPLLPIQVAGYRPGRRAVSMWVAEVEVKGWNAKEAPFPVAGMGVRFLDY